MTDITSDTSIKTDSIMGRLTFEQGKNRIVGREQGGNPRLLIVADGDQFAMKVSPAGIDVINAGGEDLIFNSDNNLFKIVLEDDGVASIPALPVASGAYTATSTQNVYPHGLGYVPIIIPFLNEAGAYIQMPYFSTFGPGLGGVGFIKYTASVDATNVYIGCSVAVYGGSAGTVPAGGDKSVKYYLLQETAN